VKVILVALLVTACGPSSREIKQAEGASYTAHRDELWPDIVDVLKSRFEHLVVAQMDGEHFVSQWMPTGRYVDIGDEQAETRMELARVTITLVGENPFQIAVKVEAATFVSDSAPPRVFRGPDEPAWVPSLNDDLSLAIYRKLRRFTKAP
jgi:hypothetical protein